MTEKKQRGVEKLVLTLARAGLGLVWEIFVGRQVLGKAKGQATPLRLLAKEANER